MGHGQEMSAPKNIKEDWTACISLEVFQPLVETISQGLHNIWHQFYDFCHVNALYMLIDK